jgi:hypothetical protein
VVVDDVADLDAGAVGEGPVSDVGLPAFVGLFGGEADEGALGPLVGLRGDEPAGSQDPPDRRHRRGAAVAPLQMEGNSRRPGFMTGLVEALADLDDLVLDGLGRAVRAARRST